MSAKAKTADTIDVGSVAADRGPSPKTRAKDPSSAILKGNVRTEAAGPLAPPAETTTDNTAAVALTTIPAAATARDGKDSSPEAQSAEQPVALATSLGTEIIPAENDSPPKAKSDAESPVSSETNPPTATVRAEHDPNPEAGVGDQDAASLEGGLAASVTDERDQPDGNGLHPATGAGELASLGQDNFEALLTAGQIWTAGLQDLATQITTSAQASLGETLAAFTALSSAKSPQDALDLQTRLVRSVLDRTLAESSRAGEALVKLLEQTLAPLANRATLTVETFRKWVG